MFALARNEIKTRAGDRAGFKTKIITMANHNRADNPINQIERVANTCSRRQARENTIGKSRLVLV